MDLRKLLTPLLAAFCFVVPISANAQFAPGGVIGPSTFTFTAGSQSNIWSCNGGQSTCQLSVPSGFTGVLTVTVAQVSIGTYSNPPWSYAPGTPAYTNTITNSGSLTVNLGSNLYVQVADTTYTSGSVTVTGTCSGAVAMAPTGVASLVAGANMSVGSPPSPAVALIANPTLDASASATGSGTVGPILVAQATAQPTMQPGNPYVGNYIMGDGVTNGLWEICNNCSNSIGGYSTQHYHVLWVSFPGDATAPSDIGLGGFALGYGDASSVGENIAVGVGALENKTTFAPITGSQNIAIGNIALGYLTSGSSNLAIGIGSGQCLTTGGGNTILGDGIGLGTGCTASNNTFLGANAGFESATSTNSIAIGYQAGELVTGGSNNLFAGYDAGMQAANTVTSEVFLGSQAGQFVTGNGVVGVGPNSCEYASGNDTVCIGDGAGQGVSGTNNLRSVLIGTSAGGATTTGNSNTFIGFQSGAANTGGANNVGIGYQSLFNLTLGGNNVAVGNASCGGLLSGTWNICIGNNATLPSTTANGQMSIANAIYGFGNNTSGTGISAGCIAFYATTCTNGTVAMATPLVQPGYAQHGIVNLTTPGTCTALTACGTVTVTFSPAMTSAPECTATAATYAGYLYASTAASTASVVFTYITLGSVASAETVPVSYDCKV